MHLWQFIVYIHLLEREISADFPLFCISRYEARSIETSYLENRFLRIREKLFYYFCRRCFASVYVTYELLRDSYHIAIRIIRVHRRK